MTAQIRERLLINGEGFGISTEPLKPHLEKLDEKTKFISYITACWRGYIGTWKLHNNRLYLICLLGQGVINGQLKDVGLDYLFPKQKTVFANWFTGTIQVPYGKMTKYVHGGYLSEYEKNLFLKFEEGILTSYEAKGYQFSCRWTRK